MNQSKARERILEAALKLFASKGYEVTTIKNIAALADVNEVTIFRLFGSKSELFNAVYKEFAPSHLTPSKSVEQFVGDLETDLKTIAYTYVEQSLKNQDYIRMTFFEALHNKEMAPVISRIPDKLSSFLANYFEGLYKEGKISKFNFKKIAGMFYVILFQYILTKGSYFSNEESNDSIKELVETCVALFVSALKVEKQERCIE